MNIPHAYAPSSAVIWKPCDVDVPLRAEHATTPFLVPHTGQLWLSILITIYWGFHTQFSHFFSCG